MCRWAALGSLATLGRKTRQQGMGAGWGPWSHWGQNQGSPVPNIPPQTPSQGQAWSIRFKGFKGIVIPPGWHSGKQGAHPRAPSPVTCQHSLPAAGPHVPCHHAECGGFPSAVYTQQSETLGGGGAQTMAQQCPRSPLMAAARGAGSRRGCGTTLSWCLDGAEQ